jgi:hypothetical protein
MTSHTDRDAPGGVPCTRPATFDDITAATASHLMRALDGADGMSTADVAHLSAALRDQTAARLNHGTAMQSAVRPEPAEPTRQWLIARLQAVVDARSSFVDVDPVGLMTDLIQGGLDAGWLEHPERGT